MSPTAGRTGRETRQGSTELLILVASKEARTVAVLKIARETTGGGGLEYSGLKTPRPLKITNPNASPHQTLNLFHWKGQSMERRTIFGAHLGVALAAKSRQQLVSTRIAGRRCLPFPMHRYYATPNTLPGTTEPSSRKQVTIGNDDGRVPWGQLSPGEKASRTTQQTFNFGVILAGAIGLV